MPKVDLKKAIKDAELLQEASLKTASQMLAAQLRSKSSSKLFKEEFDEFTDEDEDLLGDVEVEEDVDPTLNPDADAAAAHTEEVPDENVIENDESEDMEDEFYEDELPVDDELEEMIREFDSEEEEVLTDDEVAVDDVTSDEEEVDDLSLDEIIAELEGFASDETQPETDPDVNTVDLETQRVEETKRLKKTVREQKEKIARLERTIHKISKSLSETNLMNSKLGYAFKLFNKFALTKEEKMKVVESFDRARSDRDVRLVYTSLAETLNTRFRKPANKTITGLAENVDRTQKVRRAVNENIVDEDALERQRLQRIAGIKGKN